MNYTDIRDHNELDDDDDQNIDVPISFAVNPCVYHWSRYMLWIPKVDVDHDDSSFATVVPSGIPVQTYKNCITPSIISVVAT